MIGKKIYVIILQDDNHCTQNDNQKFQFDVRRANVLGPIGIRAKTWAMSGCWLNNFFGANYHCTE